MSLTPEQVAAVAGIITAVILSGMAKKWVWGWQYKAMEEDRDFWRKVAMQSLGHADKALDTASTAVKKAEGA